MDAFPDAPKNLDQSDLDTLFNDILTEGVEEMKDDDLFCNADKRGLESGELETRPSGPEQIVLASNGEKSDPSWPHKISQEKISRIKASMRCDELKSEIMPQVLNNFVHIEVLIGWKFVDYSQMTQTEARDYLRYWHEGRSVYGCFECVKEGTATIGDGLYSHSTVRES